MKFLYMFLLIFFIYLTLANCITPNNINLDHVSSPLSTILMRGWMKYFTFTPNLDFEEKPKTFFINQKFFHQFEAKNQYNILNTNIKDEYGYINIPSQFYFFFVLSNETLYVINARRNNNIAETVQSIEIDWILHEKNGKPSGIEDLGILNEGYCFRLHLKTLNIWNLCADSNDEKKEWLARITSLVSPTTSPMEDKSSEITLTISKDLGFFKIENGENNNKTSWHKTNSTNYTSEGFDNLDGEWLIIQDWSQCTLACDGGKQLLQRKCIPPKIGGKDCEGPNILERECNTFPCPNVIKREIRGKSRNPIIKFQRLSNHLLRYEICIIKEGEMDLLIKNPPRSVSPRIPVRLILNNKTLTIFGFPKFDAIYKSFDLEFISLKKPPNPNEDNSCMIVLDTRDITKRVTLCIMPISLRGDQSFRELRNKWVYDIRFFKEKCQDKLKTNTRFTNKQFQNNIKEIQRIDEDPYIERRRNEIFFQRKDDLLEKIQEKDEEVKQNNIEKSVEKAAKIALQTLEKELSYEQLVIREEMLREKNEEKEIQKQIELEREKEESVEQELIRKERSKKLSTQTNELEEKIQEIQKQAILQLKQARVKTEEKLKQMKKISERKKHDAKKQINNIRAKIATTILNEARIGNISLCNPKQLEEERWNYCDKNMKDDFERLDDCKNNRGDFCYTCCENEFGKIHEDMREDCYLKCDAFIDNPYIDWNEGIKYSQS